MEYILRIAVHEDCWERQLQGLLDVCRKTPVKEIMLMEESHQIMTSPFVREKHQRMAAIYAQMANAFARAGIRHSINLVTCVGHGDNLVPKNQLLPFKKFVVDSLQESHAVYCIADKNWVNYTAEICALYAATKPAKLMIDDDFRSLNHSAEYGCFCSLHADMVSKLVGRKISQQELLCAVCGSSDDAQQIKTAWMQVNFDAQLCAARTIEKAVHAVSPETQVGLMNSGEPAHSVQGRDMNALLYAFSGGKQCLSRPSGGAYSDALHAHAVDMHQTMALSMSAITHDTFWLSEVENYPNTLYTKSKTITKLHMKMHALCGADALSLNFYDYLATPYELQGEYAEIINDAAEGVEKIEQLRKGKALCGVGIPWRKDAAQHKINRCGGLDELMPKRPLDLLLPLLGIPVQFKQAQTNVLLSDDVLCYQPKELEKMLSGGLLIDNIAAEHLCRMGFGDALGCTPCGHVEGPCAEKIVDERYGGIWTGTLFCTNWESARRSGAGITKLSLAPQAIEICSLVDYEKEYLAPAITLYDNKFGGRVCVMAAPISDYGWLFRARSVLMQSIFRTMPGCAELPFVAGGANLAPFYYYDASAKKGLLAVMNCGLDTETAVLPEIFSVENALDITDNTLFEIKPVSAKFYCTHLVQGE